jgi:hypothetical protein
VIARLVEIGQRRNGFRVPDTGEVDEKQLNLTADG